CRTRTVRVCYPPSAYCMAGTTCWPTSSPAHCDAATYLQGSQIRPVCPLANCVRPAFVDRPQVTKVSEGVAKLLFCLNLLDISSTWCACSAEGVVSDEDV